VGDPVLARFGGDVFTVLLPDLEDTDAIEHVAE
jgi:GGDEF domain-containing protein